MRKAEHGIADVAGTRERRAMAAAARMVCFRVSIDMATFCINCPVLSFAVMRAGEAPSGRRPSKHRVSWFHVKLRNSSREASSDRYLSYFGCHSSFHLSSFLCFSHLSSLFSLALSMVETNLALCTKI